MRLGWYLGSNRSESEGEFFRVTVDNPTLCARWTEKSALAHPCQTAELGGARRPLRACGPCRSERMCRLR
jgi:hypothetical protein